MAGRDGIMTKSKQGLRRWLGCIALLAALIGGGGTVQAERVLRAVVHADLKNIDPIWTTAYITRNHGYMVYDTLFGTDSNMQPRPQMVGDYSVSDDGLTWTFTLRDGLTWHDGAPVTAEDCVASLRRWGARDGMGQKLMDVVAELVAVDARSFRMVLKERYGLVLESLGKLSSNVPFMMPKRLAETDPFEQVPEIIGSGPFKFVKEAWVPGSKVVYVRNAAYVPRQEPPSFTAGAKIARVDRVEWLYMPDSLTAVNALIAGEVDYYELPPIDLIPVLAAARGVRVQILNQLGVQGWLRVNHLYPPFDHPKAREAMMWLIKQTDYLQATVGNAEYYRECPSLFGCGMPFENDAGAEAMMGHDIEKARALFAEAGYDGRPVVILQPTDIAILSGVSLVTAQMLRKAGVTVDLQALDWSTVTSRRAVSDPPDKGGWNILHTWWGIPDVSNPIANIGVSGGCREKAWFGWPCDSEIEALRDAFARATDPEQQSALARQVQARAMEIGAYGSFGQWVNPVAFRDDLRGLIAAPVTIFWNVSK